MWQTPDMEQPHAWTWKGLHTKAQTAIYTYKERKKVTFKLEFSYQEQNLGGKNLQRGASVFLCERGRSEKPMLGISTWSWRTNQHGDNCALAESTCGLCSLVACRLGIERETLNQKRGGKSASRKASEASHL